LSLSHLFISLFFTGTFKVPPVQISGYSLSVGTDYTHTDTIICHKLYANPNLSFMKAEEMLCFQSKHPRFNFAEAISFKLENKRTLFFS